MSFSSKKYFWNGFYWFLLPTVQPSNKGTLVYIKLLIYIELAKFTVIKMLLDSVQHVQQMPFLGVFVGRSLLDGWKWSIQHVQQRPTEQQLCSIYIWLKRKYILLYNRQLHFKMLLVVGRLDGWTLFLKSFPFKTLCLLLIFLVKGVRGKWWGNDRTYRESWLERNVRKSEYKKAITPGGMDAGSNCLLWDIELLIIEVKLLRWMGYIQRVVVRIGRIDVLIRSTL